MQVKQLYKRDNFLITAGTVQKLHAFYTFKLTLGLLVLGGNSFLKTTIYMYYSISNIIVETTDSNSLPPPPPNLKILHWPQTQNTGLATDN